MSVATNWTFSLRGRKCFRISFYQQSATAWLSLLIEAEEQQFLKKQRRRFIPSLSSAPVRCKPGGGHEHVFTPRAHKWLNSERLTWINQSYKAKNRGLPNRSDTAPSAMGMVPILPPLSIFVNRLLALSSKVRPFPGFRPESAFTLQTQGKVTVRLHDIPTWNLSKRELTEPAKECEIPKPQWVCEPLGSTRGTTCISILETTHVEAIETITFTKNTVTYWCFPDCYNQISSTLNDIETGTDLKTPWTGWRPLTEHTQPESHKGWNTQDILQSIPFEVWVERGTKLMPLGPKFCLSPTL